MRTHRILAVLLAPVLGLTLTHGTVATAKPGKAFPTVIQLPVDFQPEGVATAGNTFYTGSLRDGDIYRGNLRSGAGAKFIDVSDRQALGLKADRRHNLLWVAGGFTGHAYVYNLTTGAPIADLDLGGQLVNDVVVTQKAAYFTETFGPAIYKVPVSPEGVLGTPSTITVTGPASSSEPNTFGLNGIEATANGKRLIVSHTDLGKLFTVDPTTGASEEIAISGGSLKAGTLDGLLRRGHVIWVVENFANRLTKVRVSKHWSVGTIKQRVTHPAYQVPTTVARKGNRLVVVNGKFDLGFPPPLGPGAPAGTPFEAVQVKPKKKS